VLFKCLLIGQWHGLSDPKLERAPKVRLDFMLFCGLGLHAPVPDEATHCRFRNALVKGGVYDDLLGEVCRQLEDHGLKLKAAEAAIVDATLVESAARPRSHIDPPQDRAEGDAPDVPDMRFSADPDARWVKKGSKSTLGYKPFACVDEDGYIDRVHTKPKARTSPPWPRGRKYSAFWPTRPMPAVPIARRYAASTATASCERPREPPAAPVREELQQADLKVPLPSGAVLRDHEAPLRPAPRALLRLRQDLAQLAMAALGQNLLKAANKIPLNPQAPAID
jgi:transposase, IS5 family